MTQTTFALLTNKGRSKEAVALANGSDIVVTHIAIGDGTTVPSGGETKLYHEVDRKAITGHGLVTGTTNTAYFDIHLMAADGPYTIREAGLYDADGDLIAIAYYDPPIQKPTPDSGQTVEGDIRLEIAFSNVENIIVQVDTSMQVPLQRLTVCPWIPVKSAAFINPPSEPKVGDAYVIPDKATGIWKGQSQKIAEFTSAGWAITETPDGHGIGLPDGQILQKLNGSYVPQVARDVQSGKWLYAVAGGTANALTASLQPSPCNLFAGMTIRIKAGMDNSGPVTLNLNGYGARPIISLEGRALSAGALVAGRFYELVFDGENWRTMVFPFDSTDNGYVTFPGGFILQWGLVRSAAVNGGYTNVRFPIAFPRKCFAVMTNDITHPDSGYKIAAYHGVIVDTNGGAEISVGGFTSVGANPFNGGYADQYYYIAVGN